MLLNFLLYKSLISKDIYDKSLHRLKQSAYYGKDVYRFGKMVFERIIEKTV